MSESDIIPTPMAEPEPESRPARGRRAVLLSLVGAAALLGGGIYGSLSLSGGGSGGASTPADAVTNLLDAAQNSDLLGVLDTLEPAERDAMRSGITSTVDQLRRLGVLSSSADPSSISGISLHFSNVKMTTSQIRSGLAAVTLTSGSVTASVDPGQLPLGDFTRSVAGSALSKAKPQTKTSPISTGKEAIVTVEENGTWYVSLGYTIAEDARRATGAAGPDPSQSIPAVGAATAEGAVQGFIQALAGLDLQGMVRTTPPDELAALHDYASLYAPQAQSALQAARSKVAITLTNLQLSSTDLGNGTALVQIKQLGVKVVSGTTTAVYDGKCLTVTDSSDPSAGMHVCRDQISGVTSALPAPLQDIVKRLTGLHPQLGLVAVDEGGKWYFDPLRTMFTDLDNLLATISPEDLTAVKNDVKQLSSSGSGLFGGTSSGITGSLGQSGQGGA